MTTPGRTPGTDRAQRAAERAFVRAHHPDVGGDPLVLQRELARLDEPDPGPEADVELRPPGRWQPLARRARGAGRTVRRGTRRLRGRLPRGWPGARRWTGL